jgi:hypothetical protein
MPYRLGDDVDDYCIKCKRVTNHSIVSLLGEDPAKVRCRTCYNDHDFRRCEVPPSKKDLKKAQLLAEVLAGGGAPAAVAADPEGGVAPDEVPLDAVAMDAVAMDAVPLDGDAVAVEDLPVDGEEAAPKAKKGVRKGRGD